MHALNTLTVAIQFRMCTSAAQMRASLRAGGAETHPCVSPVVRTVLCAALGDDVEFAS